MSFNVQDFRSQMTGDGARPNLFEVQLNLPTALQNLNQGNKFSEKLVFTARSSQIPESQLGVVQVAYFGRNINFAGNRTFSEWTITIINDEDFLVRQVLEQWSGSINSHVGNIRNSSLLSPNDYVADGAVYQYSKTGGTESAPLVKYNFKNAWPMSISPIDLDWSDNDHFEEFTVTLQFDEWTINDGQDFPG
jgi:hypothetical protein